MLIIAIPKSASSSLAATLEETHGVPVRSRELRKAHFGRLPAEPAYRRLARFHREVKTIDRAIADLAGAPDSLVKHHWPPSAANQALLRDTRKVILLRPAEDIVRAYQRGDDTGRFPLRSFDFCFCFSEQGWLKRAERIGLLSELRRFADGWRAHDGDKLVIEFAELVGDPAGTIARVEDYFGLARSGATELAREKYTRAEAPPPRHALALLWRRRRLFFSKKALRALSEALTGDPMAYRRVGRTLRRVGRALRLTPPSTPSRPTARD